MKAVLITLVLLFVGCGSDGGSEETNANGFGSPVVSGDNNNVNVSVVQETTEGHDMTGDDSSPCAELLWKPVSEKTGGLAILSEPGDREQWSSVAVFSSEEGIEFCLFDGLRVANEEGDLQQVWRCEMPGGAYTGEYIIEADGDACSGFVADPSARND